MGCLIFLFIGLFIFMCFNPVLSGILVIIGIVVTPWIFTAIRNSDDKIVSAEVIERTTVMTDKCEPSGFSIGLHGNPRMHWRFKQVPSYIKVKVAVVYKSGKHRVLTLTEGSSRYNRVMSRGRSN